MKLGSHVGNSGDLMLVGSINEALSYGENCFMVYLGGPQTTLRKPFNCLRAKEMQIIAKENGINLEDIIVHAPYIVNLARLDEEKHDFSVSFIASELRGVEEIGAKYLVLHPGSAVDSQRDTALKLVSDGINEILELTKDYKSVILLETMAGKGNEVGRNFEEIKTIIDGINDKSRIGVCFDTCHVHDYGYDLTNYYDTVIKEFDRIVGLKYIKVIHLNDSKNSLESHKDRHENIGFGDLGFDTLYKILTDPKFKDIPKILETPYIPTTMKSLSFPPYKEEIEMLKSGKFNPNLKEEVLHKNGF